MLKAKKIWTKVFQAKKNFQDWYTLQNYFSKTDEEMKYFQGKKHLKKFMAINQHSKKVFQYMLEREWGKQWWKP